MRVMCIQSFESARDAVIEHGALLPEVGSEYTVLEGRTAWTGAHYYRIAELTRKCGYLADHFATLPEHTSSELYHESIEAIIM